MSTLKVSCYHGEDRIDLDLEYTNPHRDVGKLAQQIAVGHFALLNPKKSIKPFDVAVMIRGPEA